jgi:redox-sensitive bicupin YhaK (pirin superfamily)
MHQAGQGLFAICIEGTCTVGGQTLGRRDAVGISGVEAVQIEATAGSDLLLIEIPHFTTGA